MLSTAPGSSEQRNRRLSNILRQAAKPTIICLNKKDQAAGFWAEARQKAVEALPEAPVVETSAASGAGTGELIDRLFDAAPQGEQMYPADYYTDQTPDFRIAEIIREKAIAHTRQEVPHALYVRMEDLEMRDDGATLWARGFILVERESQMGILVGKAGAMITDHRAGGRGRGARDLPLGREAGHPCEGGQGLAEKRSAAEEADPVGTATVSAAWRAPRR